MFLFLNPQLTNGIREMSPVLFEVAARVVSVNSVRLDVCLVGNPTGAALKPVTSELWLEGAKWKCWTERSSLTPPVSARNSPKTIACICCWHHRGAEFKQRQPWSFWLLRRVLIHPNPKARVYLYHGQIWASFSVTPLEVSYDEQRAEIHFRCSLLQFQWGFQTRGGQPLSAPCYQQI